MQSYALIQNMQVALLLSLTINVAAAFLEISKQNVHSCRPFAQNMMDGDVSEEISSHSRSSWLDKNNVFTKTDISPSTSDLDQKNRLQQKDYFDQRNEADDNKTFREDFRGTRVFVKNIPSQISWQELKDHFKVAGDVVFASVSEDMKTGKPKGHGIVQFATTKDAKQAIRIMRDYPLSGSELYVRADVQESESNALRNVVPGGKRGPTPPSKWRCADEDILQTMSQEDYKAIRQLIKSRDKSRLRRNYEASDRMREELKFEFKVHLDDRLKMWWVSNDGRNVPQAISAQKGNGRWKRPEPWRQIPTTEENDACVNPALVEGLLRQRDIARQEKDFTTADALLEKARTCPDSNLTLIIHDDSRTWRIWTDEKPSRPIIWTTEEEPSPRNPIDRKLIEHSTKNKSIKNNAAEECIALVSAHAPERVDDIRQMLHEFPGREIQILQKLRKRYI